jgi:hypothetical protein
VLAADIDGGGHYDLRGALTATGSMIVLVYSVVEAPARGWLDGRTIGGLGLSLKCDRRS